MIAAHETCAGLVRAPPDAELRRGEYRCAVPALRPSEGKVASDYTGVGVRIRLFRPRALFQEAPGNLGIVGEGSALLIRERHAARHSSSATPLWTE